jgi:DNA polymerase I-like protein with 3'-5' exonuclease and polymerase domains
MIQGVLKYMESNGIEIELSEVNHLIKKFSSSILNLYISFF